MVSAKENKLVEIIKFLNKKIEKYILVETIININNDANNPTFCNKEGKVTHPLPIDDANKFTTA